MILFQIVSMLASFDASSQDLSKLKRSAVEKIGKWKNPFPEWQHISKPKIDSLTVDIQNRELTLFFSPDLSYYPFREADCRSLVTSIENSLGRKFRKYSIKVLTNNYSVDQLVPNLYRKEMGIDQSRITGEKAKTGKLVKRMTPFDPVKGLSGNSIALWHSHGYYFEMNLDRWEFQRAKLFGTVEDISVMSYVVPYLAPMLEKAGANVFLPRERDIQRNEVIVDNDRSSGGSEVVIQPGITGKVNSGFLLTDTLYPGYNPFKHGTSFLINSGNAAFIPEIQESGSYAVYISYQALPGNSSKAVYIVNHTGGSTEFIVNQTIGGGTWIYLGTFYFEKGKSIDSGSVLVSKRGSDNESISLDAVKFGGGMGNVARRPSSEIIRNQQSANESPALSNEGSPPMINNFEWKISGKPRFLEAARYYLQYAGMPDTLVYSPNTYKNDYNDDYQSRGLWVNYLKGELGIPLDMAFAFHTDAGITPGDSTIGTLVICSTPADGGKFTDGTSRLAGRDLSDIIQTRVVEDIRTLFNPAWTRRGLWDKPYAEARRPDVPSVLLELLSHQNLADFRPGLDPRFRFHVSRAVYKGMLQFLAYNENREYVVQPLPVTHFAIEPVAGKTVRLTWQPVADALEPSAMPDKYIVYRRIGENGFDNGITVNNNWIEMELDLYETIYGFKVTAVNEGGESFDSEILSVGLKENDLFPVLVVNGFDRVAGPAWFDKDNMAGVAWWEDRGVPDHYDFITIGDQYDFDRLSPWIDDDAPGWGASYSDMAGKVTKGNSFDFPFLHGKAIMSAGHSFVSVSDEFFCSEKLPADKYRNIDIIFGEEKSTTGFPDTSKTDFAIYTPDFIQKIYELTANGANILMSGAYIGSDLKMTGDSAAIKFAAETLHFIHRTGHAVRSGGVYSTDHSKPFFAGKLSFNSEPGSETYQVEAPDAIEPSGKGSLTAFRYYENNASAGVLFSGPYKLVILGFPFETIGEESERNLLMKQIISFFDQKLK
jgi:hypothetical protein